MNFWRVQISYSFSLPNINSWVVCHYLAGFHRRHGVVLGQVSIISLLVIEPRTQIKVLGQDHFVGPVE